MAHTAAVLPAYKNVYSTPSETPRLITASQPRITPSPFQTPATTVTPPALPGFITLTQPISVRIPYGSIGLQPGTKLNLIGREGTKLRVRYADADYWIPATSTDLK